MSNIEEFGQQEGFTNLDTSDQGRSVFSTVKRAAIAIGIAVATIITAKNMPNNEEEIDHAYIGRVARDESHRLAQAGNAENLSVYDNPNYDKDKLCDVLGKTILINEFATINTERLDLKLQQRIINVLQSNEDIMFGLWFRYVEEVNRYCTEHQITTSTGEKVDGYFEDVPAGLKLNIMKRLRNEMLMPTIRSEVAKYYNEPKQPTVDEIAQSVIRKQVQEK